jgi:2-succinyl-5-enolpyruvyl-6-hydroxy-3-cyclohexene-1-carboxylate synthase
VSPLPNPSTALARVVVDEVVRNGIRHLVFAPGSRSAPLVIAAADDGRLEMHRHLDERSAAFFALGLARGSGVPAAVVTTSGTAVANLFPAVVEASMAGVPMLLLTADRPPELREIGANQTIDQHRIFGRYPRWFSELGPAEDRSGSVAAWRSTVCRAVAESLGRAGIPGPVHLNLAFREPLVPVSDDGRTAAPPFEEPIDGRPDGSPWTVRTGPEIRSGPPGTWSGVERGLVVAGYPTGRPRVDDLADRLAARLGWPLIAEPVSGGRPPQTVTTAHHLLTHAGFMERHTPDVIVVLGRVGLSRAVASLVSSTPHVVIDGPAWTDPDRTASALLSAGPDEDALQQGGGAWRRAWLDAERVARRALDEAIDAIPGPSEPRVARDVAAAAERSHLVVASSMPVRSLDMAMPAIPTTVVSNRGASGIDGFVSTVLGVSAATGDTPIGYAGDLSILHDANGLLVDPRPSAVFVVVDNDGGGIFSFLPQASFPDHFERLFGTPHGRSFERLGSFHDVGVRLVSEPDALLGEIGAARADGGVQFVVVQTDRTTNPEQHGRLTTAVHHAVDTYLDG